jgi:MFS family permease
MSETNLQLERSMERNLRLLGWWWWLRVFWLGEAIWVVYLTEKHGLTLGQVLLFQAAYAGTVLLTEVPSGILADRFGRRRVLLAAGLLFMVGLVTFGLGEGLLLLIAAFAAFGISDAAISGADSAMLYDSLQPLRRTGEFEPRMGRLNASLMAAFAGMTVAGSLMVRWTPLSTPILLSALLMIPSLFFVMKMREPPRSGGHSSLRSIGSGALKQILTTRSMWSVVLLNTVTTLAFVLMAIVQQPVLLSFGLPVWSLGIFVAIQMLVGAGGSYIAGWMGKRLGLRPVFLFVPLISSLSLLAGVSDWPWMYGFFMLPAAGFHLVFPHASGFLARRVGEGERATVISMASMVASTATVMVTPALGLLVDRASLDAGLIAASLGLATLGLLAYLAWVTSEDTKRDPRAGAETVPLVTLGDGT